MVQLVVGQIIFSDWIVVVIFNIDREFVEYEGHLGLERLEDTIEDMC